MSKRFAFGFVLLSLAASCGDDSTPAPSDEPISIGSLVALTGPLAGTGQDNNNAAILAVEQINAAGGVLGRPLRLVTVDDQTTVEGAHSGYASLLGKVTAVVGPSSSAQVVGIADLFVSGHTLTIARTATSPLITSLADDDFFFRVAPSDEFQGKVIAKRIAAANLEKLCIVHREDTYGTNLADSIVANLGSSLPVTRAPYNPSDTDLAPVLKKCDALLCSAGGGAGCSEDDKVGLVMVTYVTDGMSILSGAPGWKATKQHFFFTDGARGVELLKLGFPPATLQGALGVIPSGPDPATPAGAVLASYAKAFQARFSTSAPQYSQNAFDAVYAIAAAIELAGTTDRTAVRDALRQVNEPGGTPVSAGQWADIRETISKKQPIDFRGAGGNVDFDAHGDIKPPYYYRVWRIDNGEDVTDAIETLE